MSGFHGRLAAVQTARELVRDLGQCNVARLEAALRDELQAWTHQQRFTDLRESLDSGRPVDESDLADLPALIRHRGGAVTLGELELLLAVRPGVLTAVALAAVDPDQCGDVLTSDTAESSSDCEGHFARILLVRLWERQSAWTQAMSYTVTAGFASRALQPSDGPARFDITRSSVVAEVALACGLSDDGADAHIGTATMLCPTGSLAATHAALLQGRLTPWVARALANQTWDLTAEQIAEVQRRVLPRLQSHVDPITGRGCPAKYTSARRMIQRAVARVAPDRARRKREAAHEERGVKFRLLEGIGQITAFLPVHEAVAAWEALQAIAHIERANDVEAGAAAAARSINQCRADVFVSTITAAAQGVADGAPLPTKRISAQIAVIIDLPTLIGLRDNPGELKGYGPIDAGLARALAADSEWRRFVQEPITGHLLDLGRGRYSPNSLLRDFIRARDPLCTFPGCTAQSQRTQLDHIRPWPEGPTSSANLHALCQHHHNLKTHGYWQVRRDDDDGSTHWRSPHGLDATTPNYFADLGADDPPPF